MKNRNLTIATHDEFLCDTMSARPPRTDCRSSSSIFEVLKVPYFSLQHIKIDFGTAFTLVFVVRFYENDEWSLKIQMYRTVQSARSSNPSTKSGNFPLMEPSNQTPVTDGDLTHSLGVPESGIQMTRKTKLR